MAALMDYKLRAELRGHEEDVRIPVLLLRSCGSVLDGKACFAKPAMHDGATTCLHSQTDCIV